MLKTNNQIDDVNDVPQQSTSGISSSSSFCLFVDENDGVLDNCCSSSTRSNVLSYGCTKGLKKATKLVL